MQPKKKILLINPSRTLGIYKKVKIIVPTAPNLTIATLAASLLEKKIDVQILDLAIEKNVIEKLRIKLKEFEPDYVGITFATPTFKEIVILGNIVKKHNKNIVLIGGGPHTSALPEETLKESPLDIVVIGEGDYVLPEIVSGKKLSTIKGIYYKKGKKIFKNPPQELIENLDKLPYPAWHLYNIKRYKTTKSLTQKWPVGFIETSRGCPYGCTFCNKNIFGRKFRVKSPKRVVDEIEYLLKLGFKEIHPQDDAFSTDLKRAKEICDLIVKRKLKFPWIFGNGIRADRVDEEFLRKAKKAGCYRVHIGVESASQKLLDNINKGETIEQIKKTVKLCKKLSFDVATYFMFGLPGETEETMKQSINLAVELDTDYSRVSMLMPLPGTPIFNEWYKKGYIKSKDWSLYDFHNDMSRIYKHPDIGMELMKKYYDLFYKRFYLRPSYLLKRIIKGIFRGHFFDDFKYFINKYLFESS